MKLVNLNGHWINPNMITDVYTAEATPDLPDRIIVKYQEGHTFQLAQPDATAAQHQLNLLVTEINQALR